MMYFVRSCLFEAALRSPDSLEITSIAHCRKVVLEISEVAVGVETEIGDN